MEYHSLVREPFCHVRDGVRRFVLHQGSHQVVDDLGDGVLHKIIAVVGHFGRLCLQCAHREYTRYNQNVLRWASSAGPVQLCCSAGFEKVTNGLGITCNSVVAEVT